MSRWLLAAVLLDLVVLAPAALAQKWTVQYFYDQDRTELQLTDLAFPSAERGIAIGTIYEREGRKPRYTALVTSEGIWHTSESGRSWTRTTPVPGFGAGTGGTNRNA